MNIGERTMAACAFGRALSVGTHWSSTVASTLTESSGGVAASRSGGTARLRKLLAGGHLG
jgi:hypothetical protein